MRKIIFLTSIPFINQHLKDLYVEEIKKEFSVELWDASAIYNCFDYVNNVVAEAKSITSVFEFENELERCCSSNNVVIVTNILNQNLNMVLPSIRRFKCPVVCINKESFNAWLFEKGALAYFRFYRFKARLQALAISFPPTKYLLHKRQFGSNKYDYLLASNNYFKMQSKHFVRIHHIKFDETIKARSGEQHRVFNQKYILFIDSAPSTHPAYIKRSNSLNHASYITKMNSFFRAIENITGLRVVVSLHPKANYNKSDFGDRPVFTGNTAELINGCEFVIGHYSTSFVNVIMEKKPLVVVYYREMLKSSFRGSAVMGLQFAKMSGANICNIEQFEEGKIKAFDLALYPDFLENHICVTEKMTVNNAALVCQAIENIFLKEYKDDI